jgi:hypothetical protein
MISAAFTVAGASALAAFFVWTAHRGRRAQYEEYQT